VRKFICKNSYQTTHSQFPKQHVAAFPILQGKLVNVVPCTTQWKKEGSLLHGPAVVDTKQEDFMHIFKGWEEEVQCLIKVCGVFVYLSNPKLG